MDKMKTVTRADFEMVTVDDQDPDTSWLNEEGNEAELARYQNGDLQFVGIRARVELRIPHGKDASILHTVESPGVWGVESDSPEYHKELFKEECDVLEDMLRAMASVADREALVLARSLIRDMAHGWPSKELAEDPAVVAARLTALIGDEYDFAGGDVK